MDNQMENINKSHEDIIDLFVKIAASIAADFVKAIPVYFLWNMIMPQIFHLCSISFLQALGLTLLASFLIH